MRGLALFIPNKIALILALSCVSVLCPAKKANSEFISVDSYPENPRISAYRDSQQSHSIDQGYVIFEDQGDHVIGAFYHPQSEYYCFAGRKVESNLAVLSLPTHNEPLQILRLDLNALSSVNLAGINKQIILSACKNDVIAFLQENQTVLEASLSTSN